jgi:glucose-6-phosphate isomerase
LYEQKIYIQGGILQICPFQQWGVELEKGLANKIEAELGSSVINTAHDSSTRELMHYYQKLGMS